ncbi:MAG: CBS domain-containing protein [Deltaproteobacteria bacterium]|nr:CBS domain-containing protein [Deltaproteobacteria bacterium]MBW2106003.1 CBS domain-containing protein [Deltaproteobacteria bacterium]MBW2332444.1 CBS domain-containing protein [Deltaproteobacteria bacterium]
MYVKDIMTMNVVTIPSNTSVSDAKKIMDAHKIRRLPIVDRGKLVGIVTEHRLEAYTPSKATSLSVWEIGYLLGNTTVKEIMEKNPVTVNPEMTVEEALAIAQNRQVGSLLAIEKSGQLVGILTTNDFFYKVVNPTLGIGMPGTRVEVMSKTDKPILEDICKATSKKGMKILTLHMISSTEIGGKDIVVHVDTENVDKLIEELQDKDYEVHVRKR